MLDPILADSIKVISTQQEKVQSFMLSGWWSMLCYVVGFFGVYMQILRRAVVTVGDTKEAFKIYHKEHRNTIVMSCFAYSILMGIWYTMGVEIMALEPFKLSLLSIFIGYQAQDAFDGIAAQKTNSKKIDGDK